LEISFLPFFNLVFRLWPTHQLNDTHLLHTFVIERKE
jgi:hypothetical protein